MIDDNSLVQVVKSINRFHFSLYNRFPNDENLVYSPTGLYCLLALLQAGARGQTREELLAAMHWHADPAEVIESLSSLIRSVESEPASQSWGLSFGNAIWPDQRIDLDSGFHQRVSLRNFAHVQQLDYSGNTHGSAKTINAWVERATRGLVGSIAPSDVDLQNPLLFLTSAVYFHAKWVSRFNSTWEGEFRLLNGKKVKTPFMSGDDLRIRLHRTEQWTAFEVPYRSEKFRRFTMTIILPQSEGPEALHRLEKNLPMIWFQFHKNKVKPSMYTIVRMPEFKLASVPDIEGAFRDSGLAGIFQEQADFSGMSRNGPTYVKKIRQTPWIDVNQEGTTAAAVSSAEMIVSSPMLIDTLDVNRPFLFFVTELRSGLVLFAGRLVDPTP